MGYRFSLVLSREITDGESELLLKAGCATAVFGTDTLPTNADVTVTKMDFDDLVSETLAEAIEAGLEAVKNVPDLSVPGLEVPAQPATREDQEQAAGQAAGQAAATVAGEVLDDQDVAGAAGAAESGEPAVTAEAAEQKPGAAAKKKPSTRKPAAKKPAAKGAAKKAAGPEPEKATVDS